MFLNPNFGVCSIIQGGIDWGVSTIMCISKQYSVQGLLTVFFGKSIYFSILSTYPWLHIPKLCNVSLFCFWLVTVSLDGSSSCHGLPAFTAFLSLYSERRFFSSTHWLCCKINPWIDQNLWGALKARYVVLILEESCLPSECDAALGLAFLLEEQ